jgi:hypothetical protein
LGFALTQLPYCLASKDNFSSSFPDLVVIFPLFQYPCWAGIILSSREIQGSERRCDLPKVTQKAKTQCHQLLSW